MWKGKPLLCEVISIKILISNIQVLLPKWERRKGDPSGGGLCTEQEERAQIFYDQRGDESAVSALFPGFFLFPEV